MTLTEEYSRLLEERNALAARLAKAERWRVAVMSGFDVWQAMGPTTLTATDVSNVLDAVAKVARAADSASLCRHGAPVDACMACDMDKIVAREDPCAFGHE
jgi:hypothetical protein